MYIGWESSLRTMPNIQRKIKPNSGLARLILAMRHGSMSLRLIAGMSAVFSVAGLLGMAGSFAFHPSFNYFRYAELSLMIGALLFTILETLQRIEEFERSRKRVETAERDLRENPEKPQLAWALAQARLETYLDRNLSQVRSIYRWTIIVMMVGFILIGVGAFEAFQKPELFKASVLSAVSGVLVSFIGGTFLVIYKATMAQAKDYVTILERINAVGMSVQILESLGSDPALQHKSLAEVAKGLLTMYSHGTPSSTETSARSKRSENS
jgi:hypothetical protein